MRRRPTPIGYLKYPPDGYYRINPKNPATWKACVCGPTCSMEQGQCTRKGCLCYACYWANPSTLKSTRWMDRDPGDPEPTPTDNFKLKDWPPPLPKPQNGLDS